MSAPNVFAELAEVPWQHTWWLQVVGFMQRLANMAQASLHAEILIISGEFLPRYSASLRF